MNATNQNEPDAVTLPDVALPDVALRDKFAMSALSGLSSCVEWTAKQRAAMAYELAEAMIEARKKGGAS